MTIIVTVTTEEVVATEGMIEEVVAVNAEVAEAVVLKEGTGEIKVKMCKYENVEMVFIFAEKIPLRILTDDFHISGFSYFKLNRDVTT
jgi:hypothetical protein